MQIEFNESGTDTQAMRLRLTKLLTKGFATQTKIGLFVCWSVGRKLNFTVYYYLHTNINDM